MVDFYSEFSDDPDGKRKSKRIGSKSMAETFARKMEGQLAAGTCQNNIRKHWSGFRAEHEAKIANGMEPGTKEATLQAIVPDVLKVGTA